MLKGTESGLLIQIKDIEKDIKELELKLKSKMFITRIDFFIYPKDKEYFDRLEKLLKSFGFKLFIAEERANRTTIRMQEKKEKLELEKRLKEQLDGNKLDLANHSVEEIKTKINKTLENISELNIIDQVSEKTIVEEAVIKSSTSKNEEGNEHNDLFTYFSSLETLTIQKTLRSGQRVEHSGNVMIVGDINSGAEVFADGDIYVFGRILGTVHAGRVGNSNAMILGLSIESQRVRIASEFLEVKKISKSSGIRYEKVYIDPTGRLTVEEIG